VIPSPPGPPPTISPSPPTGLPTAPLPSPPPPLPPPCNATDNATACTTNVNATVGGRRLFSSNLLPAITYTAVGRSRGPFTGKWGSCVRVAREVSSGSNRESVAVVGSECVGHNLPRVGTWRRRLSDYDAWRRLSEAGLDLSGCVSNSSAPKTVVTGGITRHEKLPHLTWPPMPDNSFTCCSLDSEHHHRSSASSSGVAGDEQRHT